MRDDFEQNGSFASQRARQPAGIAAYCQTARLEANKEENPFYDARVYIYLDIRLTNNATA